MKSLSVKWGVILIGLVIFGHAEVWAAEWKYFGAGGDGMFWWYDAEGLVHQPDRIVQVWVKKIKVDEIKDMIEGGKKVTLSELEQMVLEKDYERSLMEINCVEKTLHYLQKLNYDSKGVLKSGESKVGTKKMIPAETVAERLYRAVCK